jgi:hypothetical protein
VNPEAMRRFWWVDVPARARRISPVLSVMLRDGIYLLKWPQVGAVAPPLALLAGFAAGWLRSGAWTTFSFSIALMSAVILLSGVSAALGLWAWCGWVLGDFFLFSHPLPAHAGLGIIVALARVRVPLIISYALLLALVATPLSARQLAAEALPRSVPPRAGTLRSNQGSSRGRRPFVIGAWAVLAAILTYGWTLVVPILIRPVLWWQLPDRESHRRIGQLAPVEAFAPLQHRGWILGVVGALTVALRYWLERRAIARPRLSSQVLYGVPGRAPVASVAMEREGRTTPAGAPQPKSTTSSMTILLLKVGAATLLLSGLAADLRDAIVLAGFILIAMLARRKLAGISAWTTMIGRVPVPIRLVIVAVMSMAISSVIIGMSWQRATTFLPMISSVGFSLLVSQALLADRGRPVARA